MYKNEVRMRCYIQAVEEEITSMKKIYRISQIEFDEYFKIAIINFGYENCFNFGKPVYAL